MTAVFIIMLLYIETEYALIVVGFYRQIEKLINVVLEENKGSPK